MNYISRSVWVGVAGLFLVNGALARQQHAPQGRAPDPAGVTARPMVPRLVTFSGALFDELGKPRIGVVGLNSMVGAGQGAVSPRLPFQVADCKLLFTRPAWRDA